MLRDLQAPRWLTLQGPRWLTLQGPRWLTPGVVFLAGSLVLTLGITAAGREPQPPPARRPVVMQLSDPAPPVEQASRTRSAVPVAPLASLRVPDLRVSSPGGLTSAQVARLTAISGVKATALLFTGTVVAEGRPLRAVGVDPSVFRAFTPRSTAESDALWAAVAANQVVASYGTRLTLGRQVVLEGAAPVAAYLGGLAAFGMPDVDVVVGAALAQQLGLRKVSVVLAAPDRRIRTLKRDVRTVVGSAAELDVLRPVAITYRRPQTYEELYRLSAQYCPGLSWKVLAAIGQVESGHGRNMGPSAAGALGPMQFLPATWAYYGVDGDGDKVADIMSPYDAVPAASLYLCRNGAGRGGQDLYNAIFAYNQADWYVKKVLAIAAQYR